MGSDVSLQNPSGTGSHCSQAAYMSSVGMSVNIHLTTQYIPEDSKLHMYQMLKNKKVKQSRYTPWRRLGGEEV